MKAATAKSTALIVVDMQNDFCPGGALAVKGGDEIVPLVNRLIDEFAHVVLTQDWHTPNHTSFASQHPGKAPFQDIELTYGAQTLWPDHCVQGTTGAAFHPDLRWTKAELVVRKGFHRSIDSYSTFYENDRTTPTGLAGYLRERGLTRLALVGLATDYCVAFSALDAASHGFETSVLLDGCRAIDLNGSLAASEKAMRDAGVKLMSASAFTG
ncbi:MAG: bifunctional nicotinamidase/pyrazinamidase [Rhodospirillaceae bacterium]|nr:bifunctional nicotinamidase/pyrazinamidase [Rhodospirillaceae bacterium]